MAPSARMPFLVSLSIHVLVLFVLIAVRDRRETPQATETAPRTSARVVFFHEPGPGGGGGGGGDRTPEPPRPITAQGSDRISAPVAQPTPLFSQPLREIPIIEVVTPLLSAVPLAAASDLKTGLIDPDQRGVGSQGPGDRDGAGAGPRGGNGPGDGVGLGDGSRKGVGGDVYRVGNGVTPPIAVRQVRPQYTTIAMTARVAGSVLVECVVLPDGTVGELRIVRSLDARYGLDEEAIKAARQWRFRPATLNGEPVAVRITIELSFSIY
jgi:protein TonB